MATASEEITYGSFFAGGGGLDIGVRLAFPMARCQLYVENEITAAKVLAANIESGALDEAPIWSSVRSFDGKPWRGKLDCVAAGFPCPDYSVAGKRAGKIGKHGQLWDYLSIAIRDVGPAIVLLENVPGILVPHRRNGGWVLPAGLWYVLGDLASLGYDAEWTCLSAADVGASHRRLRWFCLAYSRRRIAERWGDARIFSFAERVTESETHQREWCGDSASDEGEGLGLTRCEHEHAEQRAHGTEYPRTGEQLERAIDTRAGIDRQGGASQGPRTGSIGSHPRPHQGGGNPAE